MTYEQKAAEACDQVAKTSERVWQSAAVRAIVYALLAIAVAILTARGDE